MLNQKSTFRFQIQKIIFNLFENWISFFDVNNLIGIKIINSLRLNFSETTSETTSHYLLHCALFYEQKTKIFESLRNIDKKHFKLFESGNRFIKWII